MLTPNRRLERRLDIIKTLEQRFVVKAVIDLSASENEGKFLEGTGSIVLDRPNRIAYAALSPRTNAEIFQKFCEITGYKAVTFSAKDDKG
jgi:hypothetical protein